MNTSTFPSGPWTGFFNYDAGGRRFRMDLILAFETTRVTGEGWDVVGPFVVDGQYDEEVGDCVWMKSYVSAHNVQYHGFREGKGIWGTWQIPGNLHGGFHIWPVGEEPAEVLVAAKEEDAPTEPVRAR